MVYKVTNTDDSSITKNAKKTNKKTITKSSNEKDSDNRFVQNLRNAVNDFEEQLNGRFSRKASGDPNAGSDVAAGVKKAFDAIGDIVKKKAAEEERKNLEKDALRTVNKHFYDAFSRINKMFGGDGNVVDSSANEDKKKSYRSPAYDNPDIVWDENGDFHPKENLGQEYDTVLGAVEDPNDFIEFTYNPGDTFGQKILDLGLATDNGLWGDNGDVNFYTKQLIDGGYIDQNGNIRIGSPIRLRRRK